MKKVFENEKDAGTRSALIEANAFLTDKTVLKRPYSPEELRIFKDDYCALMESFTSKEDELKELSTPLKEQMKELKSQAKDFMEKIKSKCEKTEATIYGFDNQTDGTMDYYDINGEYVSSRRLMPTERQLKFKVINE